VKSPPNAREAPGKGASQMLVGDTGLEPMTSSV
jgi:hypothetical protein